MNYNRFEIIRIIKKFDFDLDEVKYSVGRAYYDGRCGTTVYIHKDINIPKKKGVKFSEGSSRYDLLRNIHSLGYDPYVKVEFEDVDRPIFIDTYKKEDEFKVVEYSSVFGFDKSLYIEKAKKFVKKGLGKLKKDKYYYKYKGRILIIGKLIIPLKNNEIFSDEDIEEFKDIYYNREIKNYDWITEYKNTKTFILYNR